MAKDCKDYKKKAECNKQDGCNYDDDKNKCKNKSGPSLSTKQIISLVFGIIFLVITVGAVLGRSYALALGSFVVSAVLIALTFTLFDEKKKKCKDITDKQTCKDKDKCTYNNDKEKCEDKDEDEDKCKDIKKKKKCNKTDGCVFKKSECKKGKADNTPKPFKLNKSSLISVDYVCNNNDAITGDITDTFWRRLKVAGYDVDEVDQDGNSVYPDGIVTDKTQVLCGLSGLQSLSIEEPDDDKKDGMTHTYACNRYDGNADKEEFDGSIRFWNKLINQEEVEPLDNQCKDGVDADTIIMDGDYGKYRITYTDENGDQKIAEVPWGHKIDLDAYEI